MTVIGEFNVLDQLMKVLIGIFGVKLEKHKKWKWEKNKIWETEENGENQSYSSLV